MNKTINHLLLVLALSTIAIFGWGCSTTKPDPLAGWQEVYTYKPPPDIVEDYQNYIHTLSPEEQTDVSLGSLIFFYEGSNGQHAILIKIGINHKVWEHVLIYDKDNKRIKVIKYSRGGYAC